MKKILLLYNGYPRLSQAYQIEEAEELSKKYELLIISWKWPLFTVKENTIPYIHNDPLNCIEQIKNFNPDIIHSHFLDNIELCYNLSKKFNIPFTIRTHSFDILTNTKFNIDHINSELCKSIIVFPEFKNKLLEKNVNESKIIATFPSINIKKFWINDIKNGNNIMSGGAFLPKKNIEGFILLAKKIKKLYPEKQVNYYSVKECENYYTKMINFNKINGSPVNFITCQSEKMPLEYKKHQWLIYTACQKLKTVGLPLMVAEAQASGVGVILYKLRPELQDYVSENGYLFTNDEEVLSIISENFSEEKREKAIELSKRYDIEINIKNLEDKWLEK